MQFASFQTTDKSHNLLEFDGYIDLGKELSILQALLSESMEKCNEVSSPFHHQGSRNYHQMAEVAGFR